MPGTERPLGGCAGTVAWVDDKKLFVFHAGDTEGFLLREKETIRMTHLHEADGAIYNYFGRGPWIEVDVKFHPLQPGDRILLVSDGVTKAFQIPEGVSVIQSFSDPADAARELAVRSRGKGSRDDITVVIFDIP